MDQRTLQNEKRLKDSKRLALLIASENYENKELKENRLGAPKNDILELSRILKNQEIGGFDVEFSPNESSQKVRERIEKFFKYKTQRREDTLLLYFSGHGLKDENGQLHLATVNTDPKLLESTAVSSRFIADMINASYSRRKIILLDCCFSGGFIKGIGLKGRNDAITRDQFCDSKNRYGEGVYILTSSTSTQLSREETGNRRKTRLSVFTRSIIEGIRTGKADQSPTDGWITVDELFDYVGEYINEITKKKPNRYEPDSEQTPEHSNFGKRGEIIIARNPKWKPITYDLSKWVTIHDSKNKISSLPFAGITAMETYLASQKRFVLLSAHYLYKKMKMHDEIPQITGSYFPTLLYVIQHFGVITEKDWNNEINRNKYPKRTNNIDPGQQDSIYRARLHTCDTYEDIPKYLSKDMPILAVTKVSEDWFDEKKLSKGRINPPASTSKYQGEIIIVIVSYDPTNKSIRFANCWGRKWGDKGFGTMTEETALACLNLKAGLFAVEVEPSSKERIKIPQRRPG